MGNGFRHGPACCCCRDIWNGGNDQIRIVDQDTDELISNATNGLGDFDGKAKRAWGTLFSASNVNYDIVYVEQDKTDTTIITSRTTDPNLRVNFSCTADPENQRLFFWEYLTTSSLQLWKINYDGSGATSIYSPVTLGGTNPRVGIYPIQYHRQLDRVYFTLDYIYTGNPLNGRRQLWHIDTDGSNATMIYEFTAQDANEDPELLFLQDLDYINQKVWFYELRRKTTGPLAYENLVRTIDFDGSNVATILTEDISTRTNRALAVSYKDQCLYTYNYRASLSAAADTLGGMFKRDFSYNEIEKIANRNTTLLTINYFRNGCGFETVGPSNLKGYV